MGGFDKRGSMHHHFLQNEAKLSRIQALQRLQLGTLLLILQVHFADNNSVLVKE